MNLYLVTFERLWYSKKVYVVAKDFFEAEQKAAKFLSMVHGLDYAHAKNISVIAINDPYNEVSFCDNKAGGDG